MGKGGSTTVALVWRDREARTESGPEKLERTQMRLNGGRDLLQPLDRQLVVDAQQLPTVLLVDAAMGSPGARETVVAVSSEAPRLSHEAKRGDAGQSLKPLSRIRCQAQLAFLRTDDHIGSLRAVLDQSRHARSSPLFYRKHLMHPMRDVSSP